MKVVEEIKECQVAIEMFPSLKGSIHEIHIKWLLKGRNITHMDIDEIQLIIEMFKLEIKMTRAATII